MLKVEVATTPEKLSRGLMYRDSLPADAGMLFVFDRSQQLSFWGRNTFLPLDIAFITKEGRVESISKIRKLSEIPVRSKNACLYALEANEGYFASKDISPGDHMLLDQHGDQWIVKFEKGDGSVKTAQSKKAPKLHPMLPFDQKFNEPMPDWLQEASDFRKDQTGITGGSPPFGPTDPTGHGFEGTEQPDESTLPEIDIGDIMLADDEDNENEPWEGGEQEDPAAMNPDEFVRDQEQQAEEQAPPPPSPQDIPDPRRMGTQDALQYAMDKGLCMMIGYRCKNAKRKIGRKAPRVIYRVVQPHGFYMAHTTGNLLVVTWDLTVSDFRCYIVNNISSKSFSGMTFRKWFRVSGDIKEKIKVKPDENTRATDGPASMDAPKEPQIG